MKTITINGGSFNDLEGFYNEVDRVLTKDLNFKTGHNLDAFNDILRGGFGVTERGRDYNDFEPYKLVWVDFAKSIEALGPELIETLREIIVCHEHIEFVAID